MFLLHDLENLVAVACTAAGVVENGYEPDSPTTSNADITPPPMNLGM